MGHLAGARGECGNLGKGGVEGVSMQVRQCTSVYLHTKFYGQQILHDRTNPPDLSKERKTSVTAEPHSARPLTSSRSLISGPSLLHVTLEST